MTTFTQDWFSQNIPGLTGILEEFKDKPTKMLEIGCFEGRSTLWFLDNILTHEDSRILCIDNFKGSAEHPKMGVDLENLESRFESNIGNNPKVDLYVGDSLYGLRGIYPPDPTFDVVYVDGSHYQVNVLEDAVLSWPLLKVGGLMIFDDYGFCDPELNLYPARAMVSFVQIYEQHLEIIYSGWMLAVRKISGVKHE